jgi:hypothetical protein
MSRGPMPMEHRGRRGLPGFLARRRYVDCPKADRRHRSLKFAAQTTAGKPSCNPIGET